METFPETWCNHLKEKGVQVLLNTSSSQVSFSDQGKATIQTDKGILEADHVISSLPLYALSDLVVNQRPEFHSMCNSLDYIDMGVVSLEFEGKVLDPKFNGFGFLVPSTEPISILGMTFDSSVFPDHNKNDRTVLTAMAGGAWFEDQFGPPENADLDYISSLAVNSAEELLGIKETPCRIVSKIQEKCIPQYYLGHDSFAEKLKAHIKEQSLPLTLVGTWTGGVGVNDVILNSKEETIRWLGGNHMY